MTHHAALISDSLTRQQPKLCDWISTSCGVPFTSYLSLLGDRGLKIKVFPRSSIAGSKIRDKATQHHPNIIRIC